MAVMSRKVGVAFEVAPEQSEQFLKAKHNTSHQALVRAQRFTGKTYARSQVKVVKSVRSGKQG